MYPCSVAENLSSTAKLSSQIIFVFPKYVVLKSEFSSNLVVFNISDLIPSYLSKYSSFDLSATSAGFTLSKDLFFFLSYFFVNPISIYRFNYHRMNVFWDSYCTACNLLCC